MALRSRFLLLASFLVACGGANQSDVEHPSGDAGREPEAGVAGGSAGAAMSGGRGGGSGGGGGGAAAAASGAPGGGASGAADREVIYVAPQGNDANPGTLAQPLKTIVAARDALRASIARGLRGNATIFVRGGTYFLDAPLTLGPGDGGDDAHSVTWAAYEDERPVISGGTVIKGWTRHKGDIWKVDLPDVKAGKLWFKDLFVDGTRATRSRLEIRGDGATDSPTVELRETMPVTLTAADEAEVEIRGIWFASRMLVAKASGRSLTFMPAIDGQGAHVEWIENHLAFVDEAHEWYLDRKAGTLYYQDEPGKDPNTRAFVAGRLSQLLVVEGTPEKPVANLAFRGLAFMHTTWQFDPTTGYNEKWAGAYGADEMKLRQIPLAIDVELAHDVTFERVRVAHIGSSGIGFGRGVSRSKIVGSVVSDVAANGIVDGWRGKVRPDGTMPQDIVLNATWFPNGDAKGDDDLAPTWGSAALVPKDNVVSDNHVHHCGQVYEGTVGIHMQFQYNPRVEYNLVHDVPYAGITFEMYKGDSRDKNVYAFNHVRDVMFLGNDGDFIYHSASVQGCSIRGNYAEDGGIYLDHHGNHNLVADNTLNDFRVNTEGPQDMSNNVLMPNAAQKAAAAASTGPRPPYRAAIDTDQEPSITP